MEAACDVFAGHVIRSSEVVVTRLIVIILVYVLVIFILVVVYSFVLVRVVIMAQALHVIAWLPLISKTVLRLAHLVVVLRAKHCIFILAIVVEYFFFLSLLLLLFEGLNYFSLLLPPLLILQVVHI
jgi:hypothetical protein